MYRKMTEILTGRIVLKLNIYICNQNKKKSLLQIIWFIDLEKIKETVVAEIQQTCC